MANLNLGQDVANKRERSSYSDQILSSIAKLCRYSSLININPSVLNQKYIFSFAPDMGPGYRPVLVFPLFLLRPHSKFTRLKVGQQVEKVP